MPEISLIATKWQPSGARTGGTVTDPVWADIVIGSLAVMALVTAVVCVGSALSALLRKWREAETRLDADLERELQDRWNRTGLL